MLPIPPRVTSFNLPSALVPRLRVLTGDGAYSLSATLRDIATLAALQPLTHRRTPRWHQSGSRVKIQFTDKPAARVLPLLRAHGFRLSAVLTDLVLDPATPARLSFWRGLTPAEQREDFRRAAARAGLAVPVLVLGAAR